MQFTFIGGSIALDFLATIRNWDGERHDLVREPAAFAAWCLEAMLLTAPPDVSKSDLDGVRLFRESCYRLVHAASTATDLDRRDCQAVNEYAQELPVNVMLNSCGTLDKAGTTQQAMSSIARDLLEVVARRADQRPRQCDGLGCTRFFLDASRARNRRFCSDQICGNRAKVAAHRRREKNAPSTNG